MSRAGKRPERRRRAAQRGLTGVRRETAFEKLKPGWSWRSGMMSRARTEGQGRMSPAAQSRP